MFFVGKFDLAQRKSSFAFDVDHARTIDEDVGDTSISKQGLQRAETESFVNDIFNQPFSLLLIQ